MDPPHQAKQLVCQYLNLEDLRSARLASQEWRKAASLPITTVAVEYVLPGHRLQHIVTQQVLSAFPSTVCIIICHNQKVSFPSPAFAAVPFRGLQQLQQRPGITTPRAGVTSRWSGRAFAMLIADSQPQEAASSRQQPGKWSLLLKPLPSGDLPRHNDGHDVWCFSHTGSIVTSLLLHEDAKLSSKEVERWGSWFPAATRLHAGLGQLIKPGTRGGLLGMGVFLGLVELFLHSSAGVPIRLHEDGLQLPFLQHLELSGNLILGSLGGGLASSQLTSLALQQTLSQTEVQQLLDRQPCLKELSVLAVEPENAPPLQVLKWASSVRAVQSLQSLVEWMAEDPAVDQHLLFGPGALGLTDAKSALDYVLTPPWVKTADSLAEAMLPMPAGISARSSASAAAGSAAAVAGLTTTTMQHSAVSSAHRTIGQVMASPMTRTAAQQYLSTPAEPTAAAQSGAPVQQHSLQHLLVSCGCFVDLQPLLQLCCPERLTLATLPAITDALHRAGWLGRYVSHVSIAYLAGAIPAPLRMQLPVGASLRELQIDTTRTGAGIEVDDRALLAITSSCRQLQRLRVKARLTFGHDAGTALRGLQDLRELLLWDTRWQSVQFLLRLAADASQADTWPEMRHAMQRILRRLYYCVTCGGFAVEAVLRGRRVLCTLAWVGIAALALPVSTAATTAAMPVHEMQAARMCAAALRTARRQPFLVRPCWLPASLRVLQLHDATLRCHRHCAGCSCLALQSGSVPRQAVQQLQVVQLQIQEEISRIRFDHDCSSRESINGSSSSTAAELLAAVRREIRAGRREGLYPTMWGVVGKLLMGPVLPFAVTVAARAGILWLLRGNSSQHVRLKLTRGGSRGSRHGLTREQFWAVLAAVGLGV